MNLSNTAIFLVFLVAAWAVDPPSTTLVEDSLDFVDDDGVGSEITDATIITTTPANPNTGSSTIVTATTGASTPDTPSTAENSTTENSTTETSTTETSTSGTSTTDDSTTSSTTVITTTVPTTTAQPSAEEIFLALLAENTVALTKSDFLANILDSQTSNIISDLDKQVKSLARINDIEKLLLNVTGSLAVSEADLLQSLVNSIYKVDYFGNRTINTVSYLLKFKEVLRDHVDNFSSQLNGMQEHILSSSKGLDDKLSLVNQILKQYITPRVNNLKESFVNINASQVISETELQNLPLLRNLTETSIIKVTYLLNQLALLNQTQDRSLYLLEEAVNEPEFANLKTINDLLHTISISQKRIDLGFSVCENSRSEYKGNKYEPYLENYSKEYINNGSEELIETPLTNSKNCSCAARTYGELSEQSWNIKAAL